MIILNLFRFLGDLYLHSFISIGEIRASLDELLEYRKESYNVRSLEMNCTMIKKVNSVLNCSCMRSTRESGQEVRIGRGKPDIFLLFRSCQIEAVQRAQYSVKETYESQSSYAKLEKAKFGTEGDVRWEGIETFKSEESF